MSTGADKQRKALGRGLSTLLPSRPSPVATAAAPTHFPIDLIEPNPLQPRTIFQPERLEELAASIRANGVIQPLIVCKKGNGYQIIAGERRWRAAKIAGLMEVPIIIQEVAPAQSLEIALIENIQREDLNPIELAHAFDRLGQEMGLSHEEIGLRTGKDRVTITNTVRLLKLPKEVQLLLAERRINMGHARAILGLRDADLQIQTAQEAAAMEMSVRQVEAVVQGLTSVRRPPEAKSKAETKIDPNVKAAVEELERALGTRVRIVERSEHRGHIEIDYFSEAELDRLFQHLVK